LVYLRDAGDVLGVVKYYVCQFVSLMIQFSSKLDSFNRAETSSFAHPVQSAIIIYIKNDTDSTDIIEKGYINTFLVYLRDAGDVLGVVKYFVCQFVSLMIQFSSKFVKKEIFLMVMYLGRSPRTYLS
jgi:hypothetical protein